MSICSKKPTTWEVCLVLMERPVLSQIPVCRDVARLTARGSAMLVGRVEFSMFHILVDALMKAI